MIDGWHIKDISIFELIADPVKAKQILQIKKFIVDLVHPTPEVFGVAVESLAGQVQSLVPKNIRPFFYFNWLL